MLVALCGADPDAVDNNGSTALFYAATLGHTDATEFLVQAGADSMVKDRKGRR